MAVTKGIFAQSIATPQFVFGVNTQNVFFKSFNEPKTDNTRFFYRINGLSQPEPLILVDGVEFSDSLSNLRPDDIQRITVLKNATAVEIYGTRAVNGVIIIETKSGTKDLIEPEINATIVETENQIEPEKNATNIETENQFALNLDTAQLEHEYASDIETETVETENSFPNLKIYPNPFFGTLNIANAIGCTLIVFAEDGIIVHTQKLINPVETIVLEHLRAGVYFFCVNDGKHTKTVIGVKN